MVKFTLPFMLSTLFFASIVHASSPDNLVLAVAKQGNLSEKQAADSVQLVFNALQVELEAGRPVLIRNFGRFYLQERDARKGRNPKSGAEIDIPAKRYPRFASADGLKQVMNNVAPSSQKK